MGNRSPEKLYNDPDLAQFYDLANGWDDDFAYCARLADTASSVLDLGCGTGRLTAALGENRSVTGVDPAAAMLEIARGRPGGERVDWVLADARSVRLDRRFELVLLAGHAFQVFLTSEDQRAVLSTIAAHLEPDGRFIFDSRNPADRGWERYKAEKALTHLDHPTLGPVDAWNESSYDEDASILTYTKSYSVADTGKTFTASARIRYTPQDELATMIDDAGLVVDAWFGDWHGNPYHSDAKEIIPFGRLAR